MPYAGSLSLRINWDGNAVSGVAVKSARPQASRLLAGKTPNDAILLLPRLFSVCGKAQQAAALAVVSAAQGRDIPQLDKLELGVACEVMREHLWRLLLDWPKLLGLPQQQQQFMRWHAALNVIAADQGRAENLPAELFQVLLGIDYKERAHSTTLLEEWLNAKRGVLAPVVAALELKESRLNFAGKQAICDFMPVWTVSDVRQRFAAEMNAEFSAMPQYNQRPLETGALAHACAMPLLQTILRKHPSRLLARFIARLIDCMDSALALGNRRVEAVEAGDGGGLSMVRTARGMLLHRVRIQTERVTEYLIVAPTEWNFHPQGALQGLIGLQESNQARLRETVKLFALSLDPCVEFQIEVCDA